MTLVNCWVTQWETTKLRSLWLKHCLGHFTCLFIRNDNLWLVTVSISLFFIVYLYIFWLKQPNHIRIQLCDRYCKDLYLFVRNFHPDLWRTTQFLWLPTWVLVSAFHVRVLFILSFCMMPYTSCIVSTRHKHTKSEATVDDHKCMPCSVEGDWAVALKFVESRCYFFTICVFSFSWATHSRKWPWFVELWWKVR